MRRALTQDPRQMRAALTGVGHGTSKRTHQGSVAPGARRALFWISF
jgi:hypothetical protein